MFILLGSILFDFYQDFDDKDSFEIISGEGGKAAPVGPKLYPVAIL